MLRLFRQIRQRLFLRRPEGSMLHESSARQTSGHVLEGRVSRYFGYAIGEMSGLLAYAREVLILMDVVSRREFYLIIFQL